MILCLGPSDKIQLISGSAVALDCHISAMDYDGTTATSYRKNTAISTAATTDLSAAPASGVTRNIKTVNVRNKDASQYCTVTIQHTDGSTVVQLYQISLPPGQTLVYVEGIGWSVSPGVSIAVGAELDYVQITADSAAISATTEATAVAVITGNSITNDGTRVKVELVANYLVASGNDWNVVFLRDSTVLGTYKGAGVASASAHPAPPMALSTFDVPSAGAHTYSVRAYVSASSITFKAGAGGSGGIYLPAFLRVTKA